MGQLALLLLSLTVAGSAETPWLCGKASWYARSGGLMANGQPMDARAMTCASWFYPLGTVIEVRCLKRGHLAAMRPMMNGSRGATRPTCEQRNGSRGATRPTASPQRWNTVRVTVTDRGPSRRLAQEGRIVDLTPAAFARLTDLDEGVIEVEVLAPNVARPARAARLAPPLNTFARKGAR